MDINLLSLGCHKNLADSESLIRKLHAGGARHVDSPQDAEVILVNTCGFIESAKRESIDEILRLAALRTEGKRLVVFGCLAKRYRDELLKEIPEIDAIFGVGEEDKIAQFLHAHADANVKAALAPDSVLFHAGQPPVVMPLKVSEGCSRRCTFCAIPAIRGRHISRPPDEIIAEAQSYISAGVRELMLVAQDLTAYGQDLVGQGHDISTLLKSLAQLDGDFWIRPMYLFPTSIDDALIDVIASEPKICKYFDMPLQHSQDKMLRAMGRQGTRKDAIKLIRNIRQRVPEAAIRTAFIVGFPGESKDDFEGLLEFIELCSFERMGVFAYSREEGTPSHSMKPQVPQRVKQERMEALMEAQAEISLEHNRALVGREFRALVDRIEPDGAQVRLMSQADEIDGMVVIAKAHGLKAGDFVNVRITSASHYDLEATLA